MRLILSLPLLLVNFLAAAMDNDQAYASLDKLSKSLRTLNFTTSFVVVKNNNAEPYHWSHGLDKDDVEVEILSVQNGPHRDIVRKGNIVSYLESGIVPYSVNSAYITGPIPEILSGDTAELSKNYDFLSVGRTRILGRAAESIRIISKDEHRYGHWLWLDQVSGLLLKLAIVNNQGQVLEQVQFTHVELDEKIHPSLQQIESIDLPNVVEIPEINSEPNHSWEVSWLPEGFVEINANTHRIIHTKQPTDFKMFTDGLVDVSVYVSPSKEGNRAFGFAKDGATIAYNEVTSGVEISVVGKIPGVTAKRMANAIIFKTQ